MVGLGGREDQGMERGDDEDIRIAMCKNMISQIYMLYLPLDEDA